jgi:parallel beta-helix repeat protein
MEYVTIQEAIDCSKPGDTVYISNGLYYEHLNISKSITLIGEEKNQVVIVPSGMKHQDLINITANGVTISNLTLTNPNGYYHIQSSGIKLHNVNDCSIFNNTISMGYFRGFYLYDSEFNIIKNNNITKNYVNGISFKFSDNNNIEDNKISMNQNYGVFLDSSENNFIKNNDFMNNYWVDLNFDNSSNNQINSNSIGGSTLGIRIKSSMNNTFKNNKMDNSGFTLRGDSIAHWNTHTIDISNRVNDKPVYYLTDQKNDSIPFDAGQVILANCSNIEVKHLDLSYCTEGIILGFSSNNRLVDNKVFFGKRHGFVLYQSSNNMIENNSCGRTEWYK